MEALKKIYIGDRCMKTIVAIGGGEIGRVKVLDDGSEIQYPIETMAIDEEILRLSGEDTPKLLFVGTAYKEIEGYFEAVNNHFGGRLGCEVSELKLLDDQLSYEEISEKILSSDIVYVGGGDTIFLLDVWKKKGVDKIMKQAYDNGVVLSGLSAGACCWFDWADNLDHQEAEGFKAKLYPGVGLISGVVTPHYEEVPDDEKTIVNSLAREKDDTKIYALDNCSAVIFEDDKCRFISSQNGKSGRLIKKEVLRSPKNIEEPRL
jgi:dipeptidase E